MTNAEIVIATCLTVSAIAIMCLQVVSVTTRRRILRMQLSARARRGDTT